GVDGVSERAGGAGEQSKGVGAPGRKETAMEKTLQVEGMMCQHCVARVKKALESMEGVEEATVDLDAKTVTATLSHEVADEALRDAVVEAGYEVTGVK
ncbi:MAG: heavy metal-associated domain-containing protein, partial [Gordonibacter sp.]|uniref:heavy-metal-associated domain-containing protein n=1 Tax=Gordonibacter sp. TaxID=1968902 RepID=UPI002FC64BF6